MKKSVSFLLCAGAASCMVLGSTMTSLAGTWRQGAAPNGTQWWYDFDDGTYARDGWQWIDGNNDGLAECYYFDTDGWMLSDTTTPDGYSVNTDGAWTQNGEIQTTGASVQEEQEGQEGQEGQAQQAAGSTLWMWDIGADGSMNPKTDLINSDCDDWWDYCNTTNESMGGGFWDLGLETNVAGWAQASERGAAWKALFDRYIIPYDLADQLNSSNRQGTFTVTTPVGMTEDDKYSAALAVEMMFWIGSDGMAEVTSLEAGLNADGSVTIIAEVYMWG